MGADPRIGPYFSTTFGALRAARASFIVGELGFHAGDPKWKRAPTGAVASSFGAYLLVETAANADGTLAVSTTQKVYTSGSAYTPATNVRITSPAGVAVGAPISDPQAYLPESLSAGDNRAIVGTVVATIGPGDGTHASSYTQHQYVRASILADGVAPVTQLFDQSGGLYDGNGGDGCSCPQSPPPASVTGVAIDGFDGAVVAGQLSPPSGAYEISRYVVPAIKTPSAPRGLHAKAGKARVTVTWTAPASAGGGPIRGYNVYVGTKSGHEGAHPVNAKPLPPAARALVVGGLKRGTRYYLVVRALNGGGPSAPSNEASEVQPDGRRCGDSRAGTDARGELRSPQLTSPTDASTCRNWIRRCRLASKEVLETGPGAGTNATWVMSPSHTAAPSCSSVRRSVRDRCSRALER